METLGRLGRRPYYLLLALGLSGFAGACGSGDTVTASDRAHTTTTALDTPTTTTEGVRSTTSSSTTSTTTSSTTTTTTTTTTLPPPTTEAPTTTEVEYHERSAYDLGILNCANTDMSFKLYVRAFNGSIYGVNVEYPEYAYEISDQIGEWVDRSTYPQLDPALPEYDERTVGHLRDKGIPYLCEAGD